MIVVRFASDGAERKLMADFAPLRGGVSTAQVIDGKAVAAEVKERVAAGVRKFGAERGGDVPGLATVLIGEDPASQIYVASKRRQTEEVGMRSFHHELGEATPTDELLELIAELNEEDTVDGILVQLPLPEQVDQDAVISAIDPAKDVDGLTAASAGLLAQGRPGSSRARRAAWSSCCATRARRSPARRR